MTDLQWEEPAGYGRARRQDWASIAEALRGRPGAWAVIDTDCSASSVTRFKAGRNAAFPAGEFEFRCAGIRDSRAEKLYGRYIGAVAS